MWRKKTSLRKPKSSRTGAEKAAQFPVGERGAGFNLGVKVKLPLIDAKRPIVAYRLAVVG